jgi:drug/metabolite transporter (DMT)-like permease
LLSIIYGLSAALGWGAADFSGGLAARRTGAYRAVFHSEVIGLVFVIITLIVFREPLPAYALLGIATFAGAFGTLGLLFLFHAMASGKMSIATSVSALMTATLPVVAGSLLEGFPGALAFIGFGLSLSAIWLISRETGNNSRILAHINQLRLPLLAGICFGTYLILINNAAQQSTFWTMLASRTGGILIMVLFILSRRKSLRVLQNAWPFIILSGFLGMIGNGFYILASRTGRLDVTAVLSSLYPAATVMLAAILLKERVARSQSIGILLALLAIIFLTI